jgi:hypothetical protein
MRTTVSLDDDVAAAVQVIRAQRGIGLSAAVNELARAGLVAQPSRTRFVQRSFPMKARMDMSNIAETLDLLEGPAHR